MGGHLAEKARHCKLITALHRKLVKSDKLSSFHLAIGAAIRLILDNVIEETNHELPSAWNYRPGNRGAGFLSERDQSC
jgi:hypothetical protein